MMTVKKLCCAALMAGISLALFVIEAALPPIVPIPGVKIGLAYLPIMLIIFIGGEWNIIDAALILAARVLLSALIAGNPTALLFSVFGAVLAMLTMWGVRAFIKDNSAVIFAGALSAVAHNIGQLSAAMLIYGAGVWAFLPFLLISGVISGLLCGIVIFLLIRNPLKPIRELKELK